MTTERQPVYFHGDLIGYIENPRQYPALWRGLWVPLESDATRLFRQMLEEGQPVWVEFGHRDPLDMAQVKTLPAAEIELLLDIDDAQTLLLNPFQDN